jgi:four helix bundle protein
MATWNGPGRFGLCLDEDVPSRELYGLASQLRRAAISIPSNISEGHQQGTKSYAHFVSLALGSLAETETQIELAGRLRYAPTSDLEAISLVAVNLRRVLHGLRRSLTRPPAT